MAGNNHSRLHDVNGIKKHKIRAKIISNRKSWQGAAALVFGGGVPLVSPLATGLITVRAYCLHHNSSKGGYKQTEAMLLQATVEAGILHRITIIFTDHALSLITA